MGWMLFVFCVFFFCNVEWKEHQVEAESEVHLFVLQREPETEKCNLTVWSRFTVQLQEHSEWKAMHWHYKIVINLISFEGFNQGDLSFLWTNEKIQNMKTTGQLMHFMRTSFSCSIYSLQIQHFSMKAVVCF